MRRVSTIVLSLLVILSFTFIMSYTSAETKISSYAEDRAQIEDLQVSYLFALDFGNLNTYVYTFTEDVKRMSDAVKLLRGGILDILDKEHASIVNVF